MRFQRNPLTVLSLSNVPSSCVIEVKAFVIGIKGDVGCWRVWRLKSNQATRQKLQKSTDALSTSQNNFILLRE